MDYLQKAKRDYGLAEEAVAYADDRRAAIYLSAARAAATIAAVDDQRAAYAKAEALLADVMAKAEGS